MQTCVHDACEALAVDMSGADAAAETRVKATLPLTTFICMHCSTIEYESILLSYFFHENVLI